ncbi:AMP-binding domain-containing protein [Rhodotorula toruloides]|uniref:AMP-binding domain-containing protein n=1 Tax=Rhodotorula toruloides TaxID=5286 RepID=A0A511K918_RHOTO|nr:AMP-binding domain-containing protein [Rhodotorula toruloides]
MLAEDSYDLLDLFPPASTSTAQPFALTAASLAFIGPLPDSSLIHLAVNHLRAGEPSDYLAGDVKELSEKARGKRPEYEVEEGLESEDQGRSPMRSAQTQLRRVLILTSEREALREELARDPDVSLFGLRRDGETTRLLDMIDIRYCPTSAHLTYFLATAYVSSDPAAQDAYVAYAETGAKNRLDPSCLPYPPTLVILHNPSEYLDEPANASAGVAAYGSILAHFVSAFSSLNSPPPRLVLFDPLASPLSTYILPAHLRSSRQGKKRSRDAEETSNGAIVEAEERDMVPLRKIIERFFDWVGEAEELPSRGPAYQGRETHAFLLTCHPSPRTASRLPPKQVQSIGLEYRLHRIGDDNAEGEEEGSVRIEVVT